MENQIIPGGFYKHYKGTTVQLVSEGIDVSTKEPIIIYRYMNPETVEYEYFSRTKKDFFGKVDKEKYPNAPQETKFKYLKSASTIVINVTDF